MSDYGRFVCGRRQFCCEQVPLMETGNAYHYGQHYVFSEDKMLIANPFSNALGEKNADSATLTCFKYTK